MNTTEKQSAKWAVRTGSGSVHVLLSQGELIGGDMPIGALGGFDIAVSALPPSTPVSSEVLQLAQILVLEVQPAVGASQERIAEIRKRHPDKLIIAAVRDPSVDLVRSLLKSGVTDVLTLPLREDRLGAMLEQIRREISQNAVLELSLGKVISVVRSVGGVGATMLATQAASFHAQQDARANRQTCLFDLDIQFGNAATYLGLSSVLTLHDLLEAGSRVDGALLRSACVQAPSGLNLVAAPTDIIPLEAVSADQILNVIELATNEFDTVYLDLPGDWTNWSMSLVARSDIVLLVVELNIASLKQAKRQLALLKSQGLDNLPIHIVLNRMEKKLFRPISLADAERALGHPISFHIGNDFALVSTALDQGVLIEEIKPKSKVAKDIATIVEGCEALFERGSG